jgi:hypothetical protein
MHHFDQELSRKLFFLYQIEDYNQPTVKSRDHGSIFVNGCAMTLGPKLPPSQGIDKGIYNDTLFRLGHTFTEIGRWNSLSNIRTKEQYFQHDDISLVRVLSKDDSFLGERYSEIIRKCIQCNFGCANDLDDTNLQKAFYRNVVLPLKEMIKAVGGRPPRLHKRIGFSNKKYSRRV